MKATLKSLLSAVLSGAATGALQYAQSGHPSLRATAVAAAAGALVGVANYLQTSPLKNNG